MGSGKGRQKRAQAKKTNNNAATAKGLSRKATAEDVSIEDKIRMNAVGDAVKDLVGAAQGDDSEGFTAAFAQIKQIAEQVDLKGFLNAVHVPEDAGEYE